MILLQRVCVACLSVAAVHSAVAHGVETARSAPLPPARAAQSVTMPEGFQATLFAGEPDVVQPIAMTLDDRGRLWVIECLSYPDWKAEGSGRDRVVIFHDDNGDGRFDTRKVFWDQGRNLSGIALGFGGVWLCSLPELIFLPDRNQDDQPDGPPEVRLDGWNLKIQHNVFNALTWGPDGWLYGCHGILATSRVGSPGLPDAERVPMNCGIWRYHPVRRQFEVVAHGTTNPWGIAFDLHGQMFIANCVIKHLFHVIPGARFERMYGQDFNPYSFHLMKSCADHIHWAGGFWNTEGAEHPQNDPFGGGHAHSGAMIYLGDNWPESYRHGFFTLNVHGRRLNHDRLERFHSGYVAKHQPDLIRFQDPWFRGVTLLYGPDGGVYVADWSDAGECHDYDDIHRDNGRIFKVTYGTKLRAVHDLTKHTDLQLVELQKHPNDWLVTQARRLLQERAAQGKLAPRVPEALLEMLGESGSTATRLRALWALHVTGGIHAKLRDSLLSHSDEWLRAWTVQLSLEQMKRPQSIGKTQERVDSSLLNRLAELARADSSPIVRLYLASALPSLPPRDRAQVASGLITREEDQADPNLPPLIWYGIEPLVSASEPGAMELLRQARIPRIREWIARRLGLKLQLDSLVQSLALNKDLAFQRDVVAGLFEALRGRRDIPAPSRWPEARQSLASHPDASVRDQTETLALIFNDPVAIENLQQRAFDSSENPDKRRKALEALAQARAPGIVPWLVAALEDGALRRAAVRSLPAFEAPEAAQRILQFYSGLSKQEKTEAIHALAARSAYALSLLRAVKNGTVPRQDISPFAARLIQAHPESALREQLKETLGDVRAISRDKAREIQRYKGLLTPEALGSANLARGRTLFDRSCAACHTLFESGGKMAPELTGSQRSDLDYLLENVIDPNAVVWNQYRATYLEVVDGRLLSGVILEENESKVTLQTQTELIILPVKDIVSRTESELSIMPEGLFESLSSEEIIDLVGYLQSPRQVPPAQ